MAFEAQGEDIKFSTRVPYKLHWTGKGKLTPGGWHDFAVHVLWSRDPAKGFVKVSFDGEKVVPLAKTATLHNENVAFFQIGLFRETSNVPETILIDHVVEATTLKDVTPPPLANRADEAAPWPVRLAGGEEPVICSETEADTSASLPFPATSPGRTYISQSRTIAHGTPEATNHHHNRRR